MVTSTRVVLVTFVLLSAVSASGEWRSNSQKEADLIRATERQRLRALVDANLEVARRLHADEFQLINPVGETLSKEEYLGAIASGQLDYLIWEPESPIEVRLYGRAAVIRYRSQLEIVVKGEKVPLDRHWHTDTYEKTRWALASRLVSSNSNKVASTNTWCDDDSTRTGSRTCALPRQVHGWHSHGVCKSRMAWSGW